MNNCSRKILKPLSLNANMRLGVRVYGKILSTTYVGEILLLIYEQPYGITKEAIKARTGLKHSALTEKLKLLKDANLIINKKFYVKLSKRQKLLISDYYYALIKIHLTPMDNIDH